MKNYTKEFKESALQCQKDYPELSTPSSCRILNISASG